MSQLAGNHPAGTPHKFSLLLQVGPARNKNLILGADGSLIVRTTEVRVEAIDDEIGGVVMQKRSTATLVLSCAVMAVAMMTYVSAQRGGEPSTGAR